MLRSVATVLIGALVSLAIGILVIFGIFAPILSVTFGLEPAQSTAVQTKPLLVFVAAFSFYFGGMAAGYRARSYRRLHGVAVVAGMFLLSPALNLVAGRNPFPQFETAGNAALGFVLLLVSGAAAYLGASRGASLYAYNQRPASERALEHAKRRRVRRFPWR